jgi:hypothetical protein
MGLRENLKHSADACNHVLRTVNMRGANWDQYRGAANSWESCVGRGGTNCDRLKNEVDVCLYDVVRPKAMRLRSGRPIIEQIRIIADTATRNRCGNCGEFSASAFMWLFDQGVRPLDWMQLVGGDHAFVVIGRRDGDATDVRSWGPDAVACDPWGQGFRSGHSGSGTYPGTQFRSQMGGMVTFQHPSSIHRES